MFPLFVLLQDVGVDGGQADREDRHGHQRALGRGAGLVVPLVVVDEPTGQEGTTHNQQQIAQDGAQERALHHDDLAIPDARHTQQHLYHVAESRI
eukprot:CAMPEP_0204136826 /NCGR_PEP_ID=MMETSP0361-20130328/17053_1 /ASSEMBLY_ACC=CAM_ASM_000343 /TAXON_ID=268821 /ORGANISM="Scrippsiella Hangoei, Strain SHTV-5" /LENGTH=94 /DNA_ID=CAMNT_0051090403 /DNA_START=627 /DNA_END=911 /DNA_ORIENTATION=+